MTGGRLTTHVLDTRLGQPGRDVAFALYRIVDGERTLLLEGRTNDDGRAAGPLLQGDALTADTYEMVFQAGAYQSGLPDSAGPGFFDLIPIRFKVADPGAQYHIPLLLSPFGYSTYRGS
jgi:5-hydroxyisourate hydrolase